MCLAVMLVFGVFGAWAQSTATGTVSGQVTDAQKAAVAGTEVKLVDTSTNTALTTVSNDNGRYIFLNVNPGNYNISFNKPGFSVYQATNQMVNVGQVLTINPKLEVGSTTTTVEVTSVVGAELQTTNATVGTTLTGTSLLNLPNVGRDASTFAIFQPGVSPEGSVAGAMYDQNTFQLDGGNNQNDMDGSNNVYTGSYASNGAPTGAVPTPVESIEEIKVNTANQTADFNGSEGSQIQMVTKRGTNQWHGSAYEYYLAPNVAGANTWENNHTPFGNQGSTPIPITHYNRFGAALGGQLIPKKILGGKTYFFVNYEGFRFNQTSIIDKPVPTALFRAGVVQINQGGNWTPYNLNPSPVTVGGTTYPSAVCNGGACDPRGIGMNPVVSALWSKYMPLPNDPLGGDHFNTQGYRGSVLVPTTSNNYVARIDHDFSDKWRFFATYRDYVYRHTTTNQVDLGGGIPGDTLGQYAALASRPQDPSFWAAGLTTNITPTTTNNFNFSYLRTYWAWGSALAPAQLPNLAAGALEIGGESSSALIPYNVNTQSVRTRFWDGQDKSLKDDLTMIKGNHLLTVGGTYERNYDYHQRTDNGQGIMNQLVYQIGSGPGIAYSNAYEPAGLPSNQVGNWTRLYSQALGIVNQPQDLYTRSGPQLTLQAPGTPMFDQSIIPSYNVYFSDTWHMKPTLTLSYGIGYTVEMPPYELNGKQVALTDATGNSVSIQNYMDARKAAALQGQVYNPTLGFATVANVNGGEKYPYNPFYDGLSPHVAAAWNPKFDSGILGKIFGNGKTVVRGGYNRIFSRLNGVDLVLVPLLGTGLGQAVSCIGASMTGQCLGNGGVNQATAFRIGTDGRTAPLPAVGQTLPQPYIPGIGGNAAAGSGSALDPNFRPARTDNVTVSIQRELMPKVIVEAGYIGRIIRNEWQQVNFDAVPYMTTLGGQSFAQAFNAMYWPITAGGTPAPQPFIENALGGAGSAFCKGFSSCTAAVAANGTMNNQIATTSVYDLWATLNRNSSWTLGRTMPSSSSAAIPAGQMSAIYMQGSTGFGNYNAAYATLTTQGWHGLTTRANFTWGRALGTGNQVQASSSYTVQDPWNMNAMYGPQFYDYKFLFNMSMVWDDPFYRGQKGIIGHLLGGWTIAPIFTARGGAPLFTNNLNGSCQSFGETNCSTGGTTDGAVLSAKYTGGTSALYNQNVPDSASGAGTGANYANGGVGVQLFSNPSQVYNEFRNCVLGYDTNCGAQVAGGIRGMPVWNLDATIAKDIGVWKEGRVGATLTFQFTNILNHAQLGDPGMDISNPSGFGVINSMTPGWSPRQVEFGLRVHF